jgi:hypothetical protein
LSEGFAYNINLTLSEEITVAVENVLNNVLNAEAVDPCVSMEKGEIPLLP